MSQNPHLQSQVPDTAGPSIASAARYPYTVEEADSSAWMDEVAATAADMLGVDAAVVVLHMASGPRFAGSFNFRSEWTGLVNFGYLEALAASSSTVCTDALVDERLTDCPLVAEPVGMRFMAAVPILDADQQSMGALIAMGRTPKKPTHQELRSLKLLAVQAKLLLCEHSHDLHDLARNVRSARCTLFDQASGRVLAFNETAHRSLDYQSHEFAARTADQLEAVLSPFELGRRFMEVGQIRGLSLFETLHRSRDGSTLAAHVCMRAAQWNGQPLICAVWINPEEVNEDRMELLAAAVKDLEVMTASVSHDLRAPLRHIAGFAKLLLDEDGYAEGTTARKYAQRIADATGKMASIIDQLLEYASLGRVPIHYQLVSLDDLVTDCLNQLGGELALRKVEWTIGPLPVVRGDPVLLRQVVQNLVENAVKYTGKKPVPRIEIGPLNGPGRLGFFIRDNGAGFAMKSAKQLFEVCHRLHAESDFPGTGIGLANVRRILARHDGHIWFEAAVDAGATFFVSLPR